MADEAYNALNNLNIELLISLIHKSPALWDRTTELYKNRVKKEAAWREVLTVLNSDYTSWDERSKRVYGKIVIQKWNHIRDNYQRSTKKIQNQKRLGHLKTTKPYLYSKQLTFLRKVLLFDDPVNNEDNNNMDSESDGNSNDNSLEYEEPEISSYTIDANDTINSIEDYKSVRNNINIDKNPLNTSMINNTMDSFSHQEPKVMDRHISFFNGILPSLDDLVDSEVLEFQLGVLQLIKSIKTSRENSFLSTLKVDDDI